MPATTTRHRRYLLAPLVVIGVFGLAACSQAAATGSTTDPTTGAQSGSTSTGNTGAADFEAFRSCLAENGATLPERGAGGGTPPAGDGAAANGAAANGAAAKGAAPDGAVPDGAAPDGGTAPPAGSTPPSGAPSSAGSGPRAGRPGMNAAPPGVDADTWAKAKEACADLMPAPPAGKGT